MTDGAQPVGNDEGDSARRVNDYRLIRDVAAELNRRIPKGLTAEQFFGGVVRRAIDEVLTLHPKRWSMAHLTSTEKTYIGTRVEILVREALDVGIGKHADIALAGHDVDIKWSKSSTWMIGPENIGTVCLGIGTNDSSTSLTVGLFVPHADLLGAQNRDLKYSAGAAFRQRHVRWLVEAGTLPPNFFDSLATDDREYILSGSSAQERIRRLGERCLNVPVPRSALQFASLNKADFMRRIREDRRAGSAPLGDMVCLSWKYKKQTLAALGITLRRDEFVFVKR